MLEHLVQLLSSQSLGAAHGFVLFVLLLCGLGVPLPEDIVLVTGGVLTWLAAPMAEDSLRGLLTHPGVLAMMLTGTVGCLAGDSIIFFAGRRFGSRVAEIPLLQRLLPPAKLRRVEELMRRRGRIVAVMARFMPGLRAPTFFTAGHSRFPYWQFLLFDGLAALVSAPFWVGLGFWFGDDIQMAARTAGRFGRYLLVASLVVVLVLVARALIRRREQA